MGFNFPSTPTIGDVYQGYTWDGQKWVGLGLSGFADAPNDGNLRGRKNAAWEVIRKKNYIINGAMMVSQENGTIAGTTNGYHPVDQFYLGVNGTSGVCSVQQVAAVTPAGSPNRIRATVTTADASVGASDLIWIVHSVEGLRAADLCFGSAAAKTITVQFGCKGPAGTYCVATINAATNRCYVAEYTISAGEANTSVVKSVTIPGDQSGTWDTGNARGVELRWGLMTGSTFQQAAGSWGTANAIGSSNQFNFMGTNGNVFELFDVSLTEGSVAPAFQVPDYASELLACRRYWQNNFVSIDVSYAVAGQVGVQTVGYVPSMRAASTITFGTPINNTNNGGPFVFVGFDRSVTIHIVNTAAARAYWYGPIIANARL